MNIAFIPVRGGSKSIPLKNIKLINKRPLIYWVLDAANKCDSIDRIVISTDSELIKKCVKNYNSNKIELFDRSPETATDTASTESAMLEYAEKNIFDTIVLIQATSPLLTYEDLDNGFKEFNKSEVDSVLSVVRQKRFVWKMKNNKFEAVNYDYYNRPRRQEFSGYLVENGAFYITGREKLISSKCRISGNISCVEMPEKTYFEIDEISDWLITEKLLEQQKKLNNLSDIKMVITDCDGVLTDGGMYYSENGDELKKFNTKDGMGFEILRNNGILTGIISGENCEVLKKRAKKLKVDEVYLEIKNKLKVVEQLCNKYGLKMKDIAYIGDDINDLEVMKRVGCGFAVKDSIKEVADCAHYITSLEGGKGAFREVVDMIVQSKRL